MKFLCDRCKTRYSIGDDRVRGKILKIRCKNCQNVITVREGMSDEGGIDPGAAGAAGATGSAERRTRPTTGGQHAGGAPGGGALGAAFQSQLTKPPPALEEEWYVSIDGVQSGPFSLPEAQKWVGAKPFDADLHCWSEGFDDWLPVDKVSHFRGLRKQPPPPPARATGKTTPPPIPKREEEPKPLFAATMASLEKSASASLPSLAPAPAPSLKVPSIPSLGAKTNGTGPTPTPMTGKGTSPMPSMPSIPSRTQSPQSGKTPAPMSAGAAALAQAFNTEDVADSRTSIEAPAFKDEGATAAEPFSARRGGEREDPFFPRAAEPKPLPAAKPATPAAAARAPVVPVFNDDDDNLEIGEVSRVVKLADLVPKPKPVAKSQTASFDRISGTGSVPRVGGLTASTPRIGGLTGSTPRLSPSELGMNVDPSLAALSPTGEPTSDESVVAKSFRQRHRRGLIALIGIAAVMVTGVVALFVFVVNNNNDEFGPGLGGTRQIDTSRPEDIVRRQLPPPPNANPGTNPIRRPIGRPNGNNITAVNPQDEVGNGKTLQASEVEDMAAKQGEGTKRCYMRAQKGALGFEIADVKKIAVTLMVNKDGTVGDVQLSDHAKDSFGQCLISRIKGWKFRESNGGTFRISLAFTSS